MELPNPQSIFWNVFVTPIVFDLDGCEEVLILVFDLTYLKGEITSTSRKNEQFRA